MGPLRLILYSILIKFLPQPNHVGANNRIHFWIEIGFALEDRGRDVVLRQ